MSKHISTTDHISTFKKGVKKMIKNKKLSFIAIGALVVVLALGLIAFNPVNIASAATVDGDGYYHSRGPEGSHPDTKSGDDTYLAEALGISIEELQSAHEAAQSAAVEQALAEGLITQAQADRISESGFRNFRLFTGSDSGIDMDELLAEALGIPVEELNAARETAKAAAIEQAIAAGQITEEQAALLQARQAIQNYFEKDELLAKALGISVEELQTNLEEGQQIPDLLEALGLDQESFETNLQATYEEILQQALDDGFITQEQADLLLENGFHGMRSPGGGRHGGSRGGGEGFERPDDSSFRPGNGGTDTHPPAEPTDEG